MLLGRHEFCVSYELRNIHLPYGADSRSYWLCKPLTNRDDQAVRRSSSFDAGGLEPDLDFDFQHLYFSSHYHLISILDFRLVIRTSHPMIRADFPKVYFLH